MKHTHSHVHQHDHEFDHIQSAVVGHVVLFYSSAAYIGRQTKSFRLKTVKFRTKHTKTHSCPEKKTARR
jgi:hypothetical protein